MPRQSYSASLATVLQSAAVPYGVTLTVWASGATVSHYNGSPEVFEIFLFVLGGTCGYTVLALASAPAVQRLARGIPGLSMAVTGMLHPLGIGAAVGTVNLAAQAGGWLAWPLGGFAGICVYLGVVGFELMLAPLLPPARRPPE